MPSHLEGVINPDSLYEAVMNGNADSARTIAAQKLAQDQTDPLALLSGALMPAMAEVGRRFEEGEYFVPQLLRSARAMKAAMALLQPLLASAGSKSLGRVVIGTVAGDMHDIGKHLVSAVLEGAGFEVIDLGNSVPAERFVAAS